MYKVKFPLPEQIANDALECAKAIKESENIEEYKPQLIITINDLIDQGLSYFFIRPVNEGNFGFVVKNLVGLSIKTSKKTATALVPRVVKKLDKAQVVYLANFILDIVDEVVE